VPNTDYTEQDWDGRKLLTCKSCIFDTFSLPNMRKHQDAGCRPPDGEWEEEQVAYSAD